MGAPLPKVAGILSDATKLEWDDKDQTVSRMALLPYLTENFADLSNWNETDGDGKVNLSGGIVTMDGGTAYNHGIVLASGVSRQPACFEVKVKMQSSPVTNGFHLSLAGVSSLVSPLSSGQLGVYILVNNLMYVGDGTTATGACAAVSGTTEYTFRYYVEQNYDVSWARQKITIEGGIYTSETLIYQKERGGTSTPSTMYFQLGRYLNSPSNKVSFREVRIRAGYATDSPTVKMPHDAGSGCWFNNLDLTNFAMPAGMSSANLTFAYYFGDDVNGSPSSYYTLANLNALGKLTGNYRYIIIWIAGNSDGVTQIYLAKPNSATAIDGIFDPVSEAVRNSGASDVTKIKKDYVIKELGVDYTGTFDPGTAEPADVIATVRATSQTTAIISFRGGARFEYFNIYRDGGVDPINTTPITDDFEYEDTGLTASTEYSWTVKAFNQTGSSTSNTVSTKTYDEAGQPTDTIVSDLMDTIRESLLEIKNEDNSGAEFTDENIVTGQILDLDNRGDDGFSCIQIWPVGRGASGNGYESQRGISCDYEFELVLHKKVQSEDRNSGTDLKSLSRLTSAVIRQMYRFLDRDVAGNPPCAGFMFTNPNFTSMPAYEMFSDKVNSEIMKFSFRVDSQDTEL
jgi:hypothetical protein